MSDLLLKEQVGQAKAEEEDSDTADALLGAHADSHHRVHDAHETSHDRGTDFGQGAAGLERRVVGGACAPMSITPTPRLSTPDR